MFNKPTGGRKRQRLGMAGALRECYSGLLHQDVRGMGLGGLGSVLRDIRL
jgi:hypothetical protein